MVGLMGIPATKPRATAGFFMMERRKPLEVQPPFF